jgi:uncharacterized YigZ family protein
LKRSLNSEDDTFRSLERTAEGIFRDRNSRFLAFGFPVSTSEEISSILEGIRKKYHDARHHCYAYRLGIAKDIYRMNDDGEPSGTAGKPIYGQLVSHDLTDTLVVVVRYFGGTLLGAGGLINAYRSATESMLSQASIIDKFVEVHYRISFPYERLNAVMRILKDENVIPLHPEYAAECSMHLTIRKSLSEKVAARLSVIPELLLNPV